MAGKKDFSTIGGYHYTFLDQCLSKYECPICLLVMREPHIVSCCGKKFCKACMDKIPEKKCPICAQPFTSMQEKELERQILDLKVKCCTENCDWVGELRDISSHLEDQCQHFLVECTLGCGLKMKRGDLFNHCQHHCTKRSVEAQLASVVNKLERNIADLEEICRNQLQNIAQLEAEIKSSHANILLPRYSVCLNGLDEFWFSPPFYTNHSGYKLRLKFASKAHMLTGTYDVLCQLQLINGEYDRALEWPVDIDCVVVIVCNQSKDSAINVELEIAGAGKPLLEKTTESSKKMVKEKVRGVHMHSGLFLAPLLNIFSADISVASLVAKQSTNVQ